MTMLWMLSSVAAAALLGGAAWLAESLLRGRARPARWVWLTAMAASVALPVRAWFTPVPALEVPGPGPAGDGGASLAFLVAWAGGPGPSALERIDPFLVPAWMLASAVLALALVAGLARLTLRSRRWRSAEVAGTRVLLSDDFGPAVMGLRTPRVVLPSWALALDPARLRMVVLHEDEHRRSGDPLVLTAGALAALAMPWNPVLWWQLRRLRGAVEVDCDARVVRHGIPVKEYGRLLLDLGTRSEGWPLPVAAFAKPRSLLERRLTTMVCGVERGSRGRTAAMAVAVVVLVAVACDTPVPTEVAPEEIVATPEATPAGVVQHFEARETEGTVIRQRQPIIYVDGERVSEISQDLSPNRIERVEVLKGGAAEALYGPDASVGVIRIFTKEEAAGAARFQPGDAAAGTFRFQPGDAAQSTSGPAAGGVIRMRERPGGGGA